MLLITEKIRCILKEKNLSENKLAQMISYHSGSLNKMVKGEKPFPEDKIQKIAPILGVSQEEIKGWILADKYSKETLQKALHLKQEYAEQDKLIFTCKIHELMEQHNLTINPFAKAIDYNQGWLSQVVLGKEPVSKKLMQKLCNFSGFPEDEITSWSLADKYSFRVLLFALEC